MTTEPEDRTPEELEQLQQVRNLFAGTPARGIFATPTNEGDTE